MNGMTGWMPGKTCWISRKDRALDIWNWNKKSSTWSWRNISGRSLQPTFVCFCYYCVLRETVQPLARQNSGWRWPWKIRSKLFPCARRSVNLLTRGISSDCDTSQSPMAGTGKMRLFDWIWRYHAIFRCLSWPITNVPDSISFPTWARLRRMLSSKIVVLLTQRLVSLHQMAFASFEMLCDQPHQINHKSIQSKCISLAPCWCLRQD
jgi:hypothetical protein